MNCGQMIDRGQEIQNDALSSLSRFAPDPRVTIRPRHAKAST